MIKNYLDTLLSYQKQLKKTGSVFLVFLFLWYNTNAQISFTIPPLFCADEVITLSVNTGTLANSTSLWNCMPGPGVFSNPLSWVTTLSVLSPGVHTISVYVNSGPDNEYAQQTVTVLASPSISLSASSQTSCIISNSPLSAKPVSLTASGAVSYTWSSPPTQGNVNGSQNVVMPTASNCYSVSSQNTLGCIGIASICINVTPGPNILTTPGFTSVCQVAMGSPQPNVILTVSNTTAPNDINTYLWSGFGIASPNTASQIIVAVNASSEFTVTVWDSQGCASSPATASVNLSPCTGIEKANERVEFISVFPNPIKTSVHVKLNFVPATNISQLNFFVIDKYARLVKQEAISMEETVINLSDLSDGVYIIGIYRGKELIYTTKLVKQE